MLNSVSPPLRVFLLPWTWILFLRKLEESGFQLGAHHHGSHGSFFPILLPLERLELEYCHEIACLRIPSTLQLLSSLRVRHCKVLQSVETDAPNLSIFHYQGPIIQFSLGEALHLKDVNMSI